MNNSTINTAALDNMTRDEAEAMMPLAIGRLFRLMHNKVEGTPQELERQYESTRAVIMACSRAMNG